MTSASKIADILKRLGDAHYQAADELLALAGNDSAVPVSPPRPAAADSLPAAPARPPQESDFAEGSQSICPIHKTEMKAKPWDPTLFGCTKQGADPAWTNPKGYCTITSKNVAEYLRNRAAAA